MMSHWKNLGVLCIVKSNNLARWTIKWLRKYGALYHLSLFPDLITLRQNTSPSFSSLPTHKVFVTSIKVKLLSVANTDWLFSKLQGITKSFRGRTLHAEGACKYDDNVNNPFSLYESEVRPYCLVCQRWPASTLMMDTNSRGSHID